MTQNDLATFLALFLICWTFWMVSPERWPVAQEKALMYQAYNTASTDVTPTNFIRHGCACNLTSCPHVENYQNYRYTVTIKSSPPVDEDAPRDPYPWERQAAVVPKFRKPSLPPWRPRQQRARDGI